MTHWLRATSLAAAVALCALTAAPAATQQATPHSYQNVISANPFGLLLELFNAEYERAVGASTTVGIGGSTASGEDWEGNPERYLNADAFFRYYPSGAVFEGWSFGGKLGVTSVEGGSYLGYGFDVNHSWLLGANNNFYVGLGFGLKRLIGAEDHMLDVVPTIRVVNIGWAF
jgi:hypothetical protein